MQQQYKLCFTGCVSFWGALQVKLCKMLDWYAFIECWPWGKFTWTIPFCYNISYCHIFTFVIATSIILSWRHLVASEAMPLDDKPPHWDRTMDWRWRQCFPIAWNKEERSENRKGKRSGIPCFNTLKDTRLIEYARCGYLKQKSGYSTWGCWT